MTKFKGETEGYRTSCKVSLKVIVAGFKVSLKYIVSGLNKGESEGYRSRFEKVSLRVLVAGFKVSLRVIVAGSKALKSI